MARPRSLVQVKSPFSRNSRMLVLIRPEPDMQPRWLLTVNLDWQVFTGGLPPSGEESPQDQRLTAACRNCDPNSLQAVFRKRRLRSPLARVEPGGRPEG